MSPAGLLEARDADGVFFSPQEGLRACWRQGPPTEAETLAEMVHRHAAGVLAGDLALIAVTVSPAGPPSPPGTTGGEGDGRR